VRRVRADKAFMEDDGMGKSVPWLIEGFYDAVCEGQRRRHEFFRAVKVVLHLALETRRDCETVTGAFDQNGERARAHEPCHIGKMHISIRRGRATFLRNERRVRGIEGRGVDGQRFTRLTPDERGRVSKGQRQFKCNELGKCFRGVDCITTTSQS
jgi:hypothetical protein